MARATEAEVLEIIDTELSDQQVTPFLTAANLVVTQVCGEEKYGDELMKEIERWLAAHFLAIKDPRVAEEKLGDAAAKYHGKSGLGLEHTPYGQQVMLLDSHGKLAQAAMAKMPAEVKVIA